MSWFPFALLSPLVCVFMNYIDKYVIEVKIKDYRCMPIYCAFVGATAGTIVWAFTGFHLMNLQDMFIVMGAGGLSLLATILYFRAMLSDEVSKLVVLFQFTPVLTLILAAVFLKELISVRQLVGFILILAAIIGVTLKKGEKSFQLSAAFFLILLADLLWAGNTILVKLVIRQVPFVSLIVYQGFGSGLCGVLLYLISPITRHSFNRSIVGIQKRVLGLMFFNEWLAILVRFLNLLAYSLGPAALVSVVGGTQIFWGIFIGWILTILYPTIYRESIKTEELIHKISFTLLLFAGIWYIC